MEQENKEITGSVVFVENTDTPQIENKVNVTDDSQLSIKKTEEVSGDTNSVATEKIAEKTTEVINDKPVIEHKQTTGVASYVSVPEITITPENINVKNISTFAVFDYLIAIIITLLFTTKIKKTLKEKIINKIMTPVTNYCFLISVFCLVLVSVMFLKSDFFDIGVQGKLSFGVSILFAVFINITAILMGIYSCKLIRSTNTSKMAGEKFAIWGLSVFNIMSILLFFITESLFGLLLSFILTLITSIIFFNGRDNEKFEKIYSIKTYIILFQFMILGMFLKSSSLIILFCLLYSNLLNKKDL